VPTGAAVKWSPMYNRLLSLIVFRWILLSLVIVFQLLSLALDFPRMPFTVLLYTVFALSIASACYVFYLKTRWEPENAANFVFVQFFVDIVAISVLVAFSGGVDSQLEFAYLIIILLSALFLERVTIYVLTVLSLAFYFLTLNFVQYAVVGVDSFGNVWAMSERISRATTSQFVICFLTALLSAFMQGTYRSGRRLMQKQEARLRSLRLMHKKIIETLPSGLITCDHRGVIQFINDTGRALLDLREDVALGANAWELFSLSDEALPCIGTETERARREVRVSIGTVSKIIGVSYSPMALEDGGTGFLIIFRDLTEIKIFEEQKSMQERMAAIGKMAAGVAHEIRNPLASISGSVQVLSELMPDQGDKTAEELAQIVAKETRRLDHIISEFLAYARPAPPPSLEPIDLGRCLDNFVTLAKNDVVSNLALSVRVLGSHNIILGDEPQLMQVFWNLVRNSYNACGDDGRVDITCRQLGGDIEVELADNGVGMTEEQLEDLFTPFQSFNQTGTGLGMSIVYDIVKIHRGDIRVTSKPGVGTRVFLTFSRVEG